MMLYHAGIKVSDCTHYERGKVCADTKVDLTLSLFLLLSYAGVFRLNYAYRLTVRFRKKVYYVSCSGVTGNKSLDRCSFL